MLDQSGGTGGEVYNIEGGVSENYVYISIAPIDFMLSEIDVIINIYADMESPPPPTEATTINTTAA